MLKLKKDRFTFLKKQNPNKSEHRCRDYKS